jgi:hypothetical protein
VVCDVCFSYTIPKPFSLICIGNLSIVDRFLCTVAVNYLAVFISILILTITDCYLGAYIKK